jgi:hypothetical protein
MRFTLYSFGDELNSRSPVKGTTDTYRKGAGRFARRNRPISLSATDDRRSRWRVSSPKYVGRPHPCGNKFELGSGRMALLKEAPIAANEA